MLLTALLVFVLIVACYVVWRKQVRRERGQNGFILIPCVSDVMVLEHRVKTAYWGERLESPATRRRILIVTFGLRAETFTAKRLAASLDNVETVDITALADRIRREV